MKAFLLCVAVLLSWPSLVNAAERTCSEEIQRGKASWYGPGFESSQTQNEELFDPNVLSAAHKTLAFGTVLKIINMMNHKSVMVRVNDRGGFGKDRVIDVSEAAARQLEMTKDGVVPVQIFRCY